jgi:hypothetical protein
MRLQKQG